MATATPTSFSSCWRASPTAKIQRKGRRAVVRCSAGNDIPATAAQSGENLGDDGVRVLEIPANSYYAVLGVSRLATEADIKSKYRELSKLYHPDTTSLPEAQAASLFMALREAYETLSDDSKRRYYDWKLTMQALEAARSGASGSPVSGRGPVSGRQNSPVPDEGGRVPLSGQAQTALAFDLFAFLVSGIVITLLLVTKGGT